MNIRPLHDRVIVKRVEEEKTSPGGIANYWITVNYVRWTLKKVTKCCLVNIPARKLKSVAMIISYCVKTTLWASLSNLNH
jgi:hypothetical protein